MFFRSFVYVNGSPIGLSVTKTAAVVMMMMVVTKTSVEVAVTVLCNDVASL